MRPRRVGIAIILIAIVAIAGVYYYTQASGSTCTQSGSITLNSAQLSASGGNGNALLSVCNGTNKTINWIGAYVNSQQFLSTGPEWIHAANGTRLSGLTTEFVSLGQLLPSQQACSFTFAGWAYDAGMTGNPGMVLNAASDNSTTTTGRVDLAYNDTQVYFESSSLNFQHVGTESGVPNVGYAPGSFKDKWTFLAIVLDNGQTSGFVNGTQVWTGKDVGCMTLQGYAIGGQQFNPFDGVIKDVSFYSTALSPGQIEQLYTNQPVSAGLAGYWSVNDGHGCTVTDSSGNSRNGVIENCITLLPDNVYYPDLEHGQNQPVGLPDIVSLSSGQSANLTIAVQFSDGTTSQTSRSVVVK